jgi:hypothetical protein
MKKAKSRQLDEQKKHLLIYISLLVASIFIVLRNPEGLWLPIGLTVGIVVDQILFIKKKKQDAKSALRAADAEQTNSAPIDKLP